MENTYSKNCGVEDESSHPTHPWGPTLKKKSVAKAKILYIYIISIYLYMYILGTEGCAKYSRTSCIIAMKGKRNRENRKMERFRMKEVRESEG